MKKIAIIAGALALAGCSQAAEEEAPMEPAETVDPAPVANLAADGRPAPGMYRITTEDGSVYMEEVKADGTYVETQDGEVTQTGRWEQRSPEEYCSAVDEAYIDEERDGTMQCSTEGIDENGVWTSTNSRGETVTVERVES